MEVAFVAEVVGDQEVVRWVDGSAQRISQNGSSPLGGSFCERVVEGGLRAVADTSQDLRVAHLEDSSSIGSYVGVPVVLADGRVYGTLCCASAGPKGAFDDKDVSYMTFLGGLLARELDRRELEERTRALELENAGITALLAALSARDGYTGAHSEAVVELAEKVGSVLGLDDEILHDVRQVALLHDIGKIGIPDAILRKEGPLDAREWRLMREHPIIGARIVESIPGLAAQGPAVRAEHERWDGAGYPDGLSRQDIPQASRVIFVCDAYHAMVSNRPYRQALSPEVAVKEVEENAGSQFGPDEARALIAVLERELDDGPRVEVAPRPLRVVLVDDDSDIRRLVRFTLEAHGGFEVVAEAGDGAEALAIVAAERPDGVVLDLSMPVMDGLEAIPRLKEAAPDTRIVVYTASGGEPVSAHAKRLGADAWVDKGTTLSAVPEALLAAREDMRLTLSSVPPCR